MVRADVLIRLWCENLATKQTLKTKSNFAGMIFYLRTIRSEARGFEEIARLADEGHGLFAGHLELDLSRCQFFDANMAAPISTVLAHIELRENSVEIINVPDPIEKILRKNGFLTLYGYPGLEDNNRTTVPFRRIQLTEEDLFEDYLRRHVKGQGTLPPSGVSLFKAYLLRYLTGKGIPQMTEGLAKAFRQEIFEVFQNAVTHSGSQFGIFVCGQYFPNQKHLDITLADAGIGIRTNVRRFLKQSVSSVDAIKWALKEGNTTKSGLTPGGLGLKLLREFISVNQGKIQIVSRRGFYEFELDRETFITLETDFLGTVVNLRINTADTSSYCLASEVSPSDIF